MPTPRHELPQIQGWLQSVIMNPAGVIDGITSADARAHIDVAPADVESVIECSSHQTSFERLQIYSGAYYARLLECLRAEFSVLTQALGGELFDEFAVEYLQRYPPHSYTLNELGANFAEFLAETRPKSATEDNSWLDFLVDLARLEWTFSEVFDGPGAERNSLLDSEQLRSVSEELWPAARLVPVPCLRILRLDFPVQNYYRATREGESAVPPDRQTTWLAISRRNFVVRHIPLTPPEAAVLAAIVAGATIGEALEQAPLGGDLDRFAADVQRWFHKWTAEGFFLTVTHDDS